MKRPNISDVKYKLSNDFECIRFNPSGYISDIDKHIDQIEAENKTLTKALETIVAVSDDARLPLVKAINQISNKALKGL
jgi:hypothetical protein